jgi:hypothetical protein
MACDPNALIIAASCFQCLDEKQRAMVQAYLLAVIAAGSTDPETLLTEAAQFQALSEKELAMVSAYLLCKINGG